MKTTHHFITKAANIFDKYTAMFPRLAGPVDKACQKFGKPTRSLVAPLALLFVGLCLAITFVQPDYRAEAYVAPYTLSNNVLRLPFSHDETLPQAQRGDTPDYIAGKTFRFNAALLPAEGLVNKGPANKEAVNKESAAKKLVTEELAPANTLATVKETTPLAHIRHKAFLKTYGLSPQEPHVLGTLTPKNDFLESLLTLDTPLSQGAAPSPYIQETNQCAPLGVTPSLLVLSHTTPGAFKQFGQQSQQDRYGPTGTQEQQGQLGKLGQLGQGRQYYSLAERYAQKYDLPSSLVMAIIKAESNFNPHAVSAQQAIGLMQIVPSTAGEEVHTYLHGYSSAPGLETLFQPDKNILYGTTYLHLLDKRYFQRIQDETSRQLCIIAAYNGGPGAVLRVFSQNMDTSLDMINAMSPDEVYSALSTGMPFAESRQYIDLVLGHIRNF